MSAPTVWLQHGQLRLALHPLREGEGRPLLLLHALGERTPDAVPGAAMAWRGPVWGLDFTGHGSSSLPRGGGYTAEILMADADLALAHLGSATLLGRGLGAWVALLLAGARPSEVLGAVLADGPGLLGGGSRPTAPALVRALLEPAGTTPDPWALVELARDLRPPDYAAGFARLAVQGSKLDWPLSVAARLTPDWLQAVCDEPGVRQCGVTQALADYTTG